MGQALLEEKAQLEESTMEEVAFDFSLKARSEWNLMALCTAHLLFSIIHKAINWFDLVT